jgi:hypothetical protein
LWRCAPDGSTPRAQPPSVAARETASDDDPEEIETRRSRQADRKIGDRKMILKEVDVPIFLSSIFLSSSAIFAAASALITLISEWPTT